MKRKTVLILCCFMFCAWASGSAGPAHPASQGDAGVGTLPVLTKNDRILILAPHPDDEAIGCAGIIQQALEAGADIHVVYLTNGDHNEISFILYEKRLTLRQGEFIHMGEVRRQEAVKAMRLLGLPQERLVFLGYPDFGTFAIFSEFWQEKQPFKSLLTRISSVPYPENLSYGAPYQGESILKDLEKVLLKFRPNKIFVSHPADTNVDHKSLYLFLEIALSDLRQEFLRPPEVYPYLIHCIDWPMPRRYHPELSLTPPQKLPGSQVRWSEYKLSRQQLEKKHQAILCYKSQTESSAFYLLTFARGNELFGDYPEVDLNLVPSYARQGQEGRISFLGYSGIFEDSGVELLGRLDKIAWDKGGVSYGAADGALFIRVDMDRKISKRFSAMFYLFGYSHKTPFPRMPKIRIICRGKRIRVLDSRTVINPRGVTVKLEARSVTLKVPLSLLGNPDFILASMRGYKGFLPVDTVGFRKINLKKGADHGGIQNDKNQ